ncbi:uncharacterized protein LOC115876457 [Sitophilus oryzae]|uniref:Uncharacterized protein LOC115876457 n=1 Tax=Sitophilus oryzae TaxID=7048 RepID=A0A6J2XA23_SITOR|nr:uncharacterized protein LOC115876457 [Sitophilus oryzae]XP_030748103.1 uncharacterized protein LOC115876457 [Sitophilus oryzae]XP_030748104.1 uncharacterized protein LOC115876457 [Sitophilus oryzae]
MQGIKRIIVFCIMTGILPPLLIITPLYLRNSVFAEVTYPVAESDVLALQEGVSSIFCESLSVKMDIPFNAFQLQGNPKPSSKRKHIRLKKSMILPDDTLEYWGFYLLKGATVKLKVCSRHEGSRILVVRGEKNLKTCGLLEHNYEKYGAKFDMEHNRVNVTYERPAEELGLVDTAADNNTAANNAGQEVFGDSEEVDIYIRKRIEKGKTRLQKINSTRSKENTTSVVREKHFALHKPNKPEYEETSERANYGRNKRNIEELDVHVQHGGNAFNQTELDNNESTSVSSFETGLLTCYDGQILLTQGFSPSRTCEKIHDLEKIDHMVTTHEVASDGYYYYIFYSDNDFVKNEIHAIFDIYKPTYQYAESAKIKECVNSTECKFDLSIMSDEVVIVEIPTHDGIEHKDDDIGFITSTCHPRMTVYMIFPILVLLLILGCAFL